MSTNLFARFKRLLPGAPLLVGEVIVAGATTCTVELPGGATVVARGVADVGDQVFVRGDLVEGPAPTFPLFLIDV